MGLRVDELVACGVGARGRAEELHVGAGQTAVLDAVVGLGKAERLLVGVVAGHQGEGCGEAAADVADHVRSIFNVSVIPKVRGRPRCTNSLPIDLK